MSSHTADAGQMYKQRYVLFSIFYCGCKLFKSVHIIFGCKGNHYIRAASKAASFLTLITQNMRLTDARHHLRILQTRRASLQTGRADVRTRRADARTQAQNGQDKADKGNIFAEISY